MVVSHHDELGGEIGNLLRDKAYDKRKQGALELEQLVRAWVLAHDIPKVTSILTTLREDYIKSTQSGPKKGGLIGLASVAIALEDQVLLGRFLEDLVKPVLGLFNDEDARVRYYACESMFNISKVAGEAILLHLDAIFDGLCTLYADVDQDVKHGVTLLDRVMKDIVVDWGQSFRADTFVPLLAERMQKRNPFIRQLLLAWIRLLLKEIEMEMVIRLKEYLEGLFNMLSDQSRDVRHNADACLITLLERVLKCPKDKALRVVVETAPIILKFCRRDNNGTVPDVTSRLNALCWLHKYVHLQIQKGSPCDEWVDMLPDLLGGILQCIDNQEEDIARMAVEVNNALLDLSTCLRGNLPVDGLVRELLRAMRSEGKMMNGSMVVRTACLQWICMLLVQSSERMLVRPTLDLLFEPIFETLQHTDDEVVAAALGVLAQIMQGRKEEEEDCMDERVQGRDLFTVVADRLLELFKREREMLETKGRLMIRHLCGHLDARRLYVTMARTLQHETSDQASLEFARQLVQTLSWILFTAAETKCLREELVRTGPLADLEDSIAVAAEGNPCPGPRALFLELLVPWFHNPVSALALCLWAQQDELAMELTARFATFEPTLDLLRQLDQLVHLLESPVFSRLRLRLLEPRQHPALLKCLLGLAMLLPQAGAFSILRERLQVVQSGLLLEAGSQHLGAAAIADAAGAKGAPQAGGEFPRQSRMLSWMAAPGGGGSRASSSAEGGAPARAELDVEGLLKRFDEVTARAPFC